MRKKVAVIFGGRSLESEISVVTAMQVMKNIDKSRYAVTPIYMYEGDFYAENLGNIKAYSPFSPLEHTKLTLIRGAFYEIKRNSLVKFLKPDAALICCHGGEGENGTLQGVLEYNGIAYTSPNMQISSVFMDKITSKLMFKGLNVDVMPYEYLQSSEFLKNPAALIDRLETYLSFPMIVKPASQGSSIGISVAGNPKELEFALKVACEYDDKILVEHKLVDFKEVNCAAFRDGERIIVSGTEQPVTVNAFLTFEDKYVDGGKITGNEHKIPADIGELNLAVKAITERIYFELNLNGVVRIDFLVDENKNTVYVNEINTVPGSLAYYLFEKEGYTFENFLSRLIENARLQTSRPSVHKKYKTDILSGLNGLKQGKKF